jgi:hypothetical protein
MYHKFDMTKNLLFAQFFFFLGTEHSQSRPSNLLSVAWSLTASRRGSPAPARVKLPCQAEKVKDAATCRRGHTHTWAQFSYPKILQIFSDFPSHRIFRHMHEVLNINKKYN